MRVDFPAPFGPVAQLWRTSATEDLAAAASLEAKDGNFAPLLPPRSVTTFVIGV